MFLCSIIMFVSMSLSLFVSVFICLSCLSVFLSLFHNFIILLISCLSFSFRFSLIFFFSLYPDSSPYFYSCPSHSCFSHPCLCKTLTTTSCLFLVINGTSPNRSSPYCPVLFLIQTPSLLILPALHRCSISAYKSQPEF